MAAERQISDEENQGFSYEQPPTIIDFAKPPSHGANAEGQQQDPLIKTHWHLGLKKWCLKHATPMNFLTLAIAVAAWAQYCASQGQLAVMRELLHKFSSEI